MEFRKAYRLPVLPVLEVAAALKHLIQAAWAVEAETELL